MKLREFQFKFLHRTVVTRKELLRFGIKADGEFYTVEISTLLITHSFIAISPNYSLRRLSSGLMTQTALGLLQAYSVEALLFGNLNNPTSLSKKFNYTLLFMRYYIYKKKLNEEALLLQDFINRGNHKYVLEKLTV